MDERTIRQIAVDVAKTVRCYCDLDNWQPELISGHSWVCPIHKEAIRIYQVAAKAAKAKGGEL